jgi:hypothetical protein
VLVLFSMLISMLTMLIIMLVDMLIMLSLLIIPQTASALRGSHDLAKGRSDIFGQISVARLAPHLPP